MTMTLESLGIDRLSPKERLTLIDQIWDSLPEQVHSDEIPDWHLSEISARRANAEKLPGLGRPWQDVVAELEARS